MRTVIYVRVSSKEQKEEGYSIPAQKKLLQEYARANDFKIVKEFEDDETAKSAGRTGFGQMVEFLKKSKDVDTILVEKTDRLYRNFKDYVTIDELDGTVIRFTRKTKKSEELIRIVWLKKIRKNNIYDLGVFIHELNHLIFIIAEDKGITIRLDENNETFCYLSEEIFNHFYPKLIK